MSYQKHNTCAWCGAEIQVNSAWAMDGVCDAKCATYQGLSDLGVAAGMVPPKGITAAYRDMILRAVAGLEPAK